MNSTSLDNVVINNLPPESTGIGWLDIVTAVAAVFAVVASFVSANYARKVPKEVQEMQGAQTTKQWLRQQRVENYSEYLQVVDRTLSQLHMTTQGKFLALGGKPELAVPPMNPEGFTTPLNKLSVELLEATSKCRLFFDELEEAATITYWQAFNLFTDDVVAAKSLDTFPEDSQQIQLRDTADDLIFLFQYQLGIVDEDTGKEKYAAILATFLVEDVQEPEGAQDQ